MISEAPIVHGTISVSTLTVGNHTLTGIDSSLDATSSNPVRNSVLHYALSTKQDTIGGNVVTSTDASVQVPTQGAHPGAALTTDGSSLSWKAVDTTVTTASTNLVTSGAVSTAISSLVDGVPGALNTLNELSAALNDNPATVTDILTAQGALQTQVDALRQVPDPAAATDAYVLTVDSSTPDGTGMVWAAPSGGGGTAVYFSATLPTGTYSISNPGQTTVTWLSPLADPGPDTDSSNVNCNSTGVTWSNGEVTIPTSGVYVVQLGTLVFDLSPSKELLQSASILERQIAGSGPWLQQTEVGYVDGAGGLSQTDFTSRHASGDFMGYFNQGDKLRLSVWAYSYIGVNGNGSPNLLLMVYRGNTSYLRGQLIHNYIRPTLQLTGDALVSINNGDVYIEQGARIIDGGVDIGAATPSGSVDVNTPGNYTITYNGTNPNGNAAVPIKRTVVVGLVGPNSFYTQIGQDIDGEDESESGTSVSMNGDGTVVAIGAPLNSGNGEKSGQVRVYEHNGSQWVQKGQDINGKEAFDESGTSVSINNDGTIVAIGAPNNRAAAFYGIGGLSGLVRVYQYANSQWVQMGQDLEGEDIGNYFGQSVSINSAGTIVAIGAPINSDNGTHSGHVRVYAYNGSQWLKLGQTIVGENQGDYSGISVSLNDTGSIVAIGAHRNDNENEHSVTIADAGHVRVYEYNGSQWLKLGQDIDGRSGAAYSGISVSINSDGTTLAIGAAGGNTVRYYQQPTGYARVYKYINYQWTQLGQDIDREQDHDGFGCSISISNDGTIVAIGASSNDGANGLSSGHVRIFHIYDGSNWVQIGPDIDGEAYSDKSGISVSISNDGTIAAIGAFGNDGNGLNSGHVRVYELTN